MRMVTSAWRNVQFRRVWGAGALSAIGSEVGELAVPALALITLGASATELSLVRAALVAPFLLLTLWVGVLVDRSRRRPLMIAADLARGALLLVVCGLAIAGWLSIPVLIGAAFLIGSLTVLHSLADFSFFPLVVEESALIDANARMTAMQSVIGVAGAGAGGLLVQALTAPFALILNALGCLVSGSLIARVHVREPRSQSAAATSAISGARAGVLELLRSRVLRALVSEASIWNLGNEILTIALSVLLLRTYGFGPAVLGIVLMTIGAGAFIGSSFSRRLTARFGYGRSLVGALLLGNTAPLAGIFAISTASWGGIAGLSAAFLISGAGIGIANSQSTSLRQLATAPDMRGRVNAAYRLISWGALSIGALIGGVLVTALGPWPAAAIGAAAMAAASLPVALSPVRTMTTLDAS